MQCASRAQLALGTADCHLSFVRWETFTGHIKIGASCERPDPPLLTTGRDLPRRTGHQEDAS